MTYTAKLYRRASRWYAWLRTRKEPRYTLSFLLYAFAMEKNRAHFVLLIPPIVFGSIMILLTLIAIFS